MSKKVYKKYRTLALLLTFLVALVVDLALGHPLATLGFALVPFADLTRPTKTTKAGIQTEAYVVPIDDILNFPKLLDSPTSPADLVKLVGDIVLKSGKNWYRFYSTRNMGELLSEITGNDDAKYFNVKGSLFYPDTTPDALGMMLALKDTPVVIILKEYGVACEDAQMRVVGSPCNPAYLYGSENTGKASADQKGITFSFEWESTTPALVYTGTITLPVVFEVTDITGTSSQYVSGYANVTGWDNDTTLYFDVYDNSGTLEIRAFATESDMDAGVNQVFHVVAASGDVIDDTGNGTYGGSLTIASGATLTAGDQWSVLKQVQ